MSSKVLLVDEDDRPLGLAEKLKAHTEGWLHRALSVFVFAPNGRLLLQQRAADKYHSGGLWSNTCCTHLSPSEAALAAAHRRLTEEMGFDCSLTPAFRELYHLSVGDNMIEHEYNHVFVGTAGAPDIRPNSNEVADWTWIRPSALRKDVAAHPSRYTPWFRHLLDQAIAATPTIPAEEGAPAGPSRSQHTPG